MGLGLFGFVAGVCTWFLLILVIIIAVSSSFYCLALLPCSGSLRTNTHVLIYGVTLADAFTIRAISQDEFEDVQPPPLNNKAWDKKISTLYTQSSLYRIRGEGGDVRDFRYMIRAKVSLNKKLLRRSRHDDTNYDRIKGLMESSRGILGRRCRLTSQRVNI